MENPLFDAIGIFLQITLSISIVLFAKSIQRQKERINNFDTHLARTMTKVDSLRREIRSSPGTRRVDHTEVIEAASALVTHFRDNADPDIVLKDIELIEAVLVPNKEITTPEIPPLPDKVSEFMISPYSIFPILLMLGRKL